MKTLPFRKAAIIHRDTVDDREKAARCQNLLARMRKRDLAALKDLAENFGDDLARAAYLFLGDHHGAADAVQEALLAAWDGARRTKDDTALRPWLFGILFNRCRKERRSRRRRIRREKTAARSLAAARGTAPAEASGGEDDERLQALKTA